MLDIFFAYSATDPGTIPQGGIRAAAIVGNRYMYQPVGRDNTHKVYVGELVGIDTALALTEHAELT
jgi:hypothetical protein